ncbi:MAG: nuclear transport factor 2 family protein [Solobacterium sp.]|nr:nuclear transport factor 2 family protein [Solobacterium sp.]
MTNEEILEKVEALEHELWLLKSKNEICNLMAKYENVHNQKFMHKHIGHFAMNRDDVSMQFAVSEELIGPDKVHMIFEKNFYMDEDASKGIVLKHYLTNPCIEIAKDGKTARGTWESPGYETIVNEAGELKAVWCFLAYANDFIYDEAEKAWKLWHLRICSNGGGKFSFEKGWVGDTTKYTVKTGVAKELPPTHNPYTVDFIQTSIPIAPKPYDTWDDEKWYLNENNL